MSAQEHTEALGTRATTDNEAVVRLPSYAVHWLQERMAYNQQDGAVVVAVSVAQSRWMLRVEHGQSASSIEMISTTEITSADAVGAVRSWARTANLNCKQESARAGEVRLLLSSVVVRS